MEDKAYEFIETVKSAVTVKQAAEYYGCKVNRGDMICCPFHDDRHPSMKLEQGLFLLSWLRGYRGCDRFCGAAVRPEQLRGRKEAGL